MAYVALNFAESTLASSIDAVVVTINVQVGHGARFALAASEYSFIVLQNTSGDVEICKLTGRSGDALTVVRGQDGTAARSWASGDVIQSVPCNAAIQSIAVASATTEAAAKTTPVDGDSFPLVDSAASNALKKTTGANIKAYLKSYFDTLYKAIGATVGTSDIVDGAVTSSKLANNVVVRDYGLTTSGVNVDTLTSIGSYTLNNPTGTPAGAGSFPNLLVYGTANGSSVRSQLLTAHDSGRTFFRSYTGTTWTSWVETITSGNIAFQTVASAGYATNSGALGNNAPTYYAAAGSGFTWVTSFSGTLSAGVNLAVASNYGYGIYYIVYNTSHRAVLVVVPSGGALDLSTLTDNGVFICESVVGYLLYPTITINKLSKS